MTRCHNIVEMLENKSKRASSLESKLEGGSVTIPIKAARENTRRVLSKTKSIGITQDALPDAGVELANRDVWPASHVKISSKRPRRCEWPRKI